MADAQYSWPSRKQSRVIGKATNREDGLAKSTGAAKYTYDINLKNQLVAHALGCPHAHCNIKAIDIKPAQRVAGVVHVHIMPHGEPGSEIQWQGELLAVVAAESEGAAAEGVAAIKVDYEMLDVFTDEENLEAAIKAKRTVKAGGKAVTQREPGDDDDEDEFIDAEIERLLKSSKFKVEGYYGIDVITHCCLEPHGSNIDWQNNGGNVTVEAYLSTQNVSATDDGLAKSVAASATDAKEDEDLKITADDVNVTCNFTGGGFGSKFAPDDWGVAAALISRKTKRPVKLMLSRDQEFKLGGNRPSGYIQVRLGADADGVVQVWDSHHWGTSGYTGGTVSHGVVPYVLEPKNFRRRATGVKTNTARARAWRAPNHPQACAITQTALDDLAAKMGRDSYDIFEANLQNASNGKADVYAEEMKVAARLIDWKANYHLHGKGRKRGSIVDGLGMALHTWGGSANTSSCLLKIYPDGAVESFCGTQDIGTGTRTVCKQVLAETFGLTLDDVKVNVGSSKFPVSGASGGSTTVGAVSESHRRAAQDALRTILDLTAKKLGVKADDLRVARGRIHVRGDRDKSLTWRQATSLLGLKPLEVVSNYKRGDASPLSSSGVGGVQMAHVEVDTETGVVRMKKFVLVQDQGLVMNPKTCKSQIYGAAIMGIAYALFEQRITDPRTGALLNSDMSDYNLPRLGDVGDIVVELYEPESERSRGVIGNGEPPVISPGAAISNAVANALGVRVPVLPLTPKRVLEALA